MIQEVIVVEGRDDQRAVGESVEARTIATHGYGISAATFRLIEKAYRETGIIIFTDPDFAGEQIRSRLAQRFPQAKHAYLPRALAIRDGDVGIENARPDSIRIALEKARCTLREQPDTFTRQDLFDYGLSGGPGASQLRDKIGALLGIGYGNGTVFLNRLNHYGITREELEEAWTSCMRREPSGN